MSVHHGNGGHGKTSGWTYAGRFVSGAHMDGSRRTNATFRYRATRDLTDHGRAGKWSHRAGWERAAYRVSATALTLAILYGYFTARTITVDTLAGAGAVLCVLGVMRAKYAWANFGHDRRVVKPMYQTITQITSANVHPAHVQAPNANHKRYLTVPRNYRDDKARVRYVVPQTWEAEPGQVKRINALITRRLGGDWDTIPHLNEYPAYLEFIPSPAPPKAVAFADVIRTIEQSKDSEIVLGIGTHSHIAAIDLDSEAPHIALSMGTGGGKSSLLRLIIIQLIRKGCERIDIIDPKRLSHNWAKGIPGVFIHRTMVEQMEAVAAFRKEMENRYEALTEDDTLVFPRWALIVEEQNSFMEYAKTYWEDYRNELTSQERGKVPKRNPVIGNLAYILFQGRQARMNVVSVFQRMSASASGGGDMRENYGAKILARYSAQTWKMLVGTTPVPRSSRINGRGRYALGDEDHEVQFAFVNEADAKGYGLQHAQAVSVPGFDALRDVPADNAGADEPIAPMTLREMCDAGIVPVKYGSAKRARTRAGDGYPKGKGSPVGTVYDPREVTAWHEARGKQRKNANAN